MDPLFSCDQFAVFRNEDQSDVWFGYYRGEVIEAAIPIDNGERCVVLTEYDVGRRPVHNLFCVDRGGRRVWTANPPSLSDVFVGITRTSEGLAATTWSGYQVLLDLSNGCEISRRFVK